MDGKVNPYFPQDRVKDTFDIFNQHGYVMYPQQRKIYENLAYWFKKNGSSLWDHVLEAGCGNGVGSSILYDTLQSLSIPFVATDVDRRHTDFASCLYPNILFGSWDLTKPNKIARASYTVAIEVFEHLSNPQLAMDNLLGSCKLGVWLSTPNGTGKPRPPENPHHVREYTPMEIEEFADNAGAQKVTMFHWKTFQELDTAAGVDPLVYLIEK